ncbi:hypothetical protein BOTBODRAFT_28631 [Botryobasidium botryosum FD-172 SS1]|uniref:DUF6593 domain-containing protein n=1 Tax=Botryobasidium botryosum (strain FD-172 SS1) TaxID=930990 RepID=A0A067MU54_BOTB1|nr:hypothetical protein BOTBODRAFT_28631 [Botryobasidium botryosum FD-172 SS1]
MSLQSGKKDTTIYDGQGRVAAHIEWDHSHPRIQFGGHKMKTCEFMPRLKKTQGRSMTVAGRHYEWCDLSDETVALFHPGEYQDPSRMLAQISDFNGILVLTMYPRGFQEGLLETALIAAFLVGCGKQFGDMGSSSNFGMLMGIAAAGN